ncbi:hypothetical protein K432DRAFT_383707 [Lepidopterella palustris CBS 459.81]|uniref:Uncharacterized protein n=1 Tax=Lepidopterella palustris CBS 459.81 TaxID=1314670 RepID=A0A8E2JDM6_9PEZI|nr:hypothetical protein K432DRAFT_383707 [Lepidopterella palustris CBS 459.81]
MDVSWLWHVVRGLSYAFIFENHFEHENFQYYDYISRRVVVFYPRTFVLFFSPYFILYNPQETQ